MENGSNKYGFYNKKSSIFENIYLITIVILITFSFIVYAVYYYYIGGINDIKPNSSYYGEDLLNYEPLFSDNVTNLQDCIDRCNKDIICDGITYNNKTQICSGTKNGIVRSEGENYTAWIKPITSNKPKDKNFKNAVLLGMTSGPKLIPGNNISNPYLIGHYSYSFDIIIKDFYKNYGYWRHIFHKGTHIDSNQPIKYQSWENLIKDLPIQTIGVWLAPFTNNLRIAISTNNLKGNQTGYYSDAFIQKCDKNNEECYITDLPSGKWADKQLITDGTNPKTTIANYVEYIDQDLQNIPINRKVNILINIRGRNIEIYFNGKLKKIAQLDGIPVFNNSNNSTKTNLYVFYEYNVNAELTNLLYYPDDLSLYDISQIMDL
jgi:hypothetical protein